MVSAWSGWGQPLHWSELISEFGTRLIHRQPLPDDFALLRYAPLIMRLLGQVAIFAVVCYGIHENDVPEHLRKNFDDNKLILPVSQEFGQEFYANMTTKAFSAVLRSMAQEKMRSLPEPVRVKIERCFAITKDFSDEAVCFVALLDRERRMKKRTRHKILRRIEILVSRRIPQKFVKTSTSKQAFSKRRVPRSIVSKESYDLLPVSNASIVGTLSRHLRKTAALMRGSDSSALRGWRSLVEELAQHRGRSEKQRQLTDMFTSGHRIPQSVLENGQKDSLDGSAKNNNAELRQLDAFLKQGVKLVASAAGNEVGNRSIRILSPRIGTARKDTDEISLLSPDIPISADSRRESPDRSALLELLLELSGATNGMRMALDRLKNDTFQMTKEDVEKTLGKREKRKIDVVQAMEKTYSSNQMESFRNRGFAFMDGRQRRLVYGRTSPYHDEGFLRRSRGFRPEQLERKLINVIRLQSMAKSDYGRRMKIDLINSPTIGALFVDAPLTNVVSVFSPVILSAFISSPTLVGPLILSPWLLSALVASPWALCPIILSPFTFVPIILSPVAMSPFVLSPGIFSPAILSPLLMVPYILSPGVFNPLILSPLLLSPLVLSPTAAAPVILSPTLLAPVILSPLYHSAVVLSPSLLSPVIMSDGANVAIILSPDLGML